MADHLKSSRGALGRKLEKCAPQFVDGVTDNAENGSSRINAASPASDGGLPTSSGCPCCAGLKYLATSLRSHALLEAARNGSARNA